MSSISSKELNYLVFRYLQESGFTHAAFALGYEAGINKSTIDGHKIPPGALVKFVQKGLQYIELEANSTADVDDEFILLEPLDIITMDVNELRRVINEKKGTLLKEHDKDKETDVEPSRVNELERECEREPKKLDRGKERERDKDKQEGNKDQERTKEREKQMEIHMEREPSRVHDDKMTSKLDENGICGGPEPMDISTTTTFSNSEVPSSDVTVLEGHTSEVFACAWSPTGSLLASGSGDSTARIWSIPYGPCASNMQTGTSDVLVLKHFRGRTNEKSKDVTTLDWNGEGTLLATGSYDGHARIWSRDG